MTGVRAPVLRGMSVVSDALTAQLLDLLRQQGPQRLPYLQNKLSVASNLRFKDLIEAQVRAGAIERVHGAVRLAGDTREVPLDCVNNGVAVWNKAQIEILRRGYPTMTRQQLMTRLPGFSWQQIITRAGLLYLSRARLADLADARKARGS